MKDVAAHLREAAEALGAAGIPEPSYVLRAIGLSHDQAASSIRFCVGRDTTRQDVQDAGTLIAEALQKLQLEAA